jgi:hypothetical protein
MRPPATTSSASSAQPEFLPKTSDLPSDEISNIAQELLAKALARIDELEKTKVLNEEMIERAVLRALTKTRLTIGDGA